MALVFSRERKFARRDGPDNFPRTTKLASPPGQNLLRLGRPRRRKHRDAPFQNSRLFAADVAIAASQNLLVIPTQRSQQAQFRLHHIGGIQPPAQPRLPNHEIHPGRPENPQSQDCSRLEKGRPAGPGNLAQNPQQWPQFLLQGAGTHRHPTQPKALPEIHEMRRGVKPGHESRGPQDRIQRRCRGALAIGSGDMDEVQIPLGVSQPGQQRSRPFQARPDAGGADRLQPGDGIVSLQR